MTCCAGSGCCGRSTSAGSRRPSAMPRPWWGGCGWRGTRSGSEECRAATRRGRLRPKVQARPPRAISDAQWDELFAQMRCTRDRALLACYVSSGARASELLGVGLADIDWQSGRLWVISKGTRIRQDVPVSPEALAYLAAYLDEAGLPSKGGPVWRTRRGDPRPLTYWAARRILQRAADRLGANWMLHDCRHILFPLRRPGWPATQG